MKRLFFLLCIGVFIAGSLFFYQLSAELVFQNNTITIQKGAAVDEILDQLVAENIIPASYRFSFLAYLKWQGIIPELKAGKHYLVEGSNLKDLAYLLTTNPASSEITFTIPEGYTSQQIDEMLTQKQLISAGDLSNCVQNCDFSEINLLKDTPSIEGFLFPDTYRINPTSFESKVFLERLVNTFSQKISSLEAEITTSGRSLHDIVIMASMIEKEAITDEERPIVSGILWKRYDEGMLLGVDATVRYALNNWDKPLTVTDLNINSPFNTRRFAGLPPSAICNPGLESLKAAISPVESPYYYYLHSPDGQIRYGRTLEEHNENKRRYL